ncbi:hypothetical protein F1559_001934 [Cyanidiococcus yangmingshanensis]|uniref:Chromatin target of PRMT1 protein C-terminal domain-containing protein n=1 Tax=Cyanidiococcus yangmingshanensis TaxID=2690220 RepID=A0A7J7IEH3_9RHOD|nr:hypothetical protein F1559_001934 [Cyanidiococcus yangmingshanensis]
METAQRAVKQFHSLTLDGQPLVVEIEHTGAQRRGDSAKTALSGSLGRSMLSSPLRAKKRSLGKSVVAQLPPVPAPTAEAVGGLRIVAGKGGVRDVLRVLGSSATPERRRRRRRRTGTAAAVQPMETDSTAGAGAATVAKGSASKSAARTRGRRARRRPSRQQEKEHPSKSAEELDRELEEYRMADT